METTKNKLTNQQQKFLDGLSDYLDIKLLYYGSVQRYDYVDGKSDIDTDIFTDNEESTIAKIQHYLHVEKKDFKKIIWNINNKIVRGYKIKYKNSFIELEISIYNNIYKPIVLREHQRKIVLPIFAYYILYVLKVLYYYLHILPKDAYICLKRYTYTLAFGSGSDHFMVLKS